MLGTQHQPFQSTTPEQLVIMEGEMAEMDFIESLLDLEFDL